MIEIEKYFIELAQNSFIMMLVGSMLASSFHLHNGGKLLNPFSEKGITSRNNWIYILLNVSVITTLGIILAYVMYEPPSNESIKALFAGASTTIFLNNADTNSFRGKNNE